MTVAEKQIRNIMFTTIKQGKTVLAELALSMKKVKIKTVLRRENRVRGDKMKTLKKIAQGFKAVFEGNRCRFVKRCELYQKEGVVCNNYFQRFPTSEKSYCGKYRSMQEEDEEKK